MTTTRKIAIAIGVLFLVQTASYSVGGSLIDSGLDATSPDGRQIRIGVLLEFINSFANVAMGVLFFPILRKASERMALGYTASRVIEGILLIVGALGALLLIPASKGVTSAAQLELTASMATSWHDLTFQMAMISLGAGALLLCTLLYKTRLVPRPLAAMGFVGYIALFASGWLVIFGQDMGMVLFIPGAIFELALPIWLIVKGFDMTTLSASGAETRHEAKPNAATSHGQVATT